MKLELAVDPKENSSFQLRSNEKACVWNHHDDHIRPQFISRNMQSAYVWIDFIFSLIAKQQLRYKLKFGSVIIIMDRFLS